MADNRSGSPTGQLPHDNELSVAFLKTMIPSSRERLFLAGSVAGQKRLRTVGYYTDDKLRALPDNERHHVTAATYPPELGERNDSKALSVPFVVFDDIGRIIEAPDGTTSISQGIEIDESAFAEVLEPTWKIETSSGRFQYGYHFVPSLMPIQARKVHAALGATRPGRRACTRLASTSGCRQGPTPSLAAPASAPGWQRSANQ